MTVVSIDGRSVRRSVRELLPEALRLVDEQGRVPPRYLLMKLLRIGPKKADELIEVLEVEKLIDSRKITTTKDEKMKVVEGDLAEMKSTAEVVGSKSEVATVLPAEVTEEFIDSSKIASFEDKKDEEMKEVENLLVQNLRKMNRPVKQGMSLTNLRWMLRFVLVLGVVVSISGNILDADSGHPVSQAIKAWSPLALLIVIECISLVPVHTTLLMVARRAATTGIALIAAWVSYWHMVSVCVKYGETGGSEYLIPLSVDGLVVVATICLVEVSGQINAARKDAW